MRTTTPIGWFNLIMECPGCGQKDSWRTPNPEDIVIEWRAAHRHCGNPAAPSLPHVLHGPINDRSTPDHG